MREKKGEKGREDPVTIHQVSKYLHSSRMNTHFQPNTFHHALGLSGGTVVSIVGAGGKTTLMFRLAEEYRNRGKRVLVTTSTRMKIPDEGEFDGIDLSGRIFDEYSPCRPGIYVAGNLEQHHNKMVAVDLTRLHQQLNKFDLVLIEADGAARKRLKGWQTYEPVVPLFSTHTVGIIDISTIGMSIDENLVHRLDIFNQLTGTRPGDKVNVTHLKSVICEQEGLFRQSQGTKALLINKTESQTDIAHATHLRAELTGFNVVIGSLHYGWIHEDDTSAL